MVDESKRVWIQSSIFVMLSLLWLTRGLVEGSIVWTVMGTSLMFGSISLTLTAYVRSDAKVKRAIEIVFGAIAIGTIVYGYLVSGEFTLMLLTILIVAFSALAFILSYLLPRFSSKNAS